MFSKKRYFDMAEIITIKIIINDGEIGESLWKPSVLNAEEDTTAVWDCVTKSM